MLKLLKQSFLTGLILLLPIGITVLIVNFMLDYIGEPASRMLFCWLDIEIRSKLVVSILVNLISTVFVTIVITLIGMFSRYFFGRLFFGFTERMIDRIPLVRGIYKSSKQIIRTFGKSNMKAFSKTVLIPYPHPGTYAVGFLTSDVVGEAQDKTGKHVMNVFVPTTPNPTSGFLLMVPKEDIIELEMGVGDGIKMIISGGIVSPPYKQRKK